MVRDAAAHLIRALVDTAKGPGLDGGWEALAIVLEFPEGEFNEAHGYLYGHDGGVVAVACDPWAVAPAVATYTGSHYRPDEVLPRKILVQFDRSSGAYEITFEETDEARWQATPRTYGGLREELRPRLG